MSSVPDQVISVRIVADKPDRAYRSLLSQELRYCIKNQEIIQHLVERTYRRIPFWKKPGLIANSSDFGLLEQVYSSYIQKENRSGTLSIDIVPRECRLSSRKHYGEAGFRRTGGPGT